MTSHSPVSPPDRPTPRLSAGVITALLFAVVAALGGFTATRSQQSVAAPPRDLTTVTVGVPEALRGKSEAFNRERQLSIPAGIGVSLFAAGLREPRFMASSPSGVVYVSQPGAGTVVALPDPGRQGFAPAAIAVARGLLQPHGLAFRDGYLYIAENTRVVRIPDPGPEPVEASPTPEVIVAELPRGGGHWTRTIGFGPDGRLYVAVGSSCNVCIESDERRAAISVYDADGSNGRVYARGLRNTVGFTWRPGTTELWGTDNGRDNIGDDIPADEVNVIAEGADYGWPYCHSDRQPNPEYNDAGRCTGTTPPTIALRAHIAPLGLAFYTGGLLPADYTGDLFIAEHGSWNRSTAHGFDVVRARTAGWTGGSDAPATEIFATGWLQGTRGADAWGRPVDLLVAPDGALLLTDDRAGVIYRFAPAGG